MENVTLLLGIVNDDLEDIISDLENIVSGALIQNIKESILLKESVPRAISRIKEKINTATKNTDLISKALLDNKELENNDMQNWKILNYANNIRSMSVYINLTKNENSDVDLSELNTELEIFWNAHFNFKESIHEYNKIFPNKPLTTLEQAVEEIKKYENF